MSDNLVGFRLADGYEDFSGGSVTYGATQAVFNVGDAVQNAEDGVFVVEDAFLIESLRGYDALKEVPAPEGMIPVEAPGGVQPPNDSGGAPVGFIPQSGALPEEQPQEDHVAAEQEAQVAVQTPPGGDQTVEQRMAAANAEAEHADEDDDDSGITSGR